MKNEIQLDKNLERRSFFSKIGRGLAGLLILNSLPVKLFGGTTKRQNNNIKVNIHPSAVKRTKRG